MLFVLSVSIQLLCSSLANIMPITYSQAAVRYVPMATTSIREDNTTDQKCRHYKVSNLSCTHRCISHRPSTKGRSTAEVFCRYKENIYLNPLLLCTGSAFRLARIIHLQDIVDLCWNVAMCAWQDGQLLMAVFLGLWCCLPWCWWWPPKHVGM